MKRILCIVLLAAALLTALAGCGEPKQPEREVQLDNYGRSQDIPCATIPGGEYATTEEFRYSFRAASGEGIEGDWGTIAKVVSEENAPIHNYHIGSEVYLTRYVNCTLEQYHTLVADMQFADIATLHSQSNIGEKVYHSSFSKDENKYTITYVAQKGTIDVTATREQKLSPYLWESNPSTETEEIAGAATTLSILPKRTTGSGSVIQLKNGHFILIDGGNAWSLEELLVYLEEHTPAGQIPVVDAWFVTSADYDYSGWCMGFIGDENDLKYMPGLLEPVPAKQRIRVEGIYYNRPSALVEETTILREEATIDGVTYYRKSSNFWPGRVAEAAKVLTNQAGEETPLYRPQMGQVYHFSGGVQVQVLFSQEQLTHGEYGFEFDHATTWCQIQAEGNTFLATGKTTSYGLEKVANLYGDSYFDALDMLVTPNDGKDMVEAYKDVFSAPVVYYDLPDCAELTGEAAAVYEYFTQDPQIRCLCYADGVVTYDFAANTVTTE